MAALPTVAEARARALGCAPSDLDHSRLAARCRWHLDAGHLDHAATRYAHVSPDTANLLRASAFPMGLRIMNESTSSLGSIPNSISALEMFPEKAARTISFLISFSLTYPTILAFAAFVKRSPAYEILKSEHAIRRRARARLGAFDVKVPNRMLDHPFGFFLEDFFLATFFLTAFLAAPG